MKIQKEFLIKGMHCKSCELIIKEELENMDSIKCITIDFKSGKLNLEFDDAKINVLKIKNIIKKEGYDVK